jgi:Protein of unknown function (DUF669)
MLPQHTRPVLMMSANEFDLSGMDDSFAQAKATDNEVPGGKFNVIVQKAEIKPTTKNDPRLSLQLKILSGEHAGRMLFMGHMLCPVKNEAGATDAQKTADRLGRLKRDLSLCGVTIEKLSQLPAALAQLIDVKLAVRHVVKPDERNPGDMNRNVYIDKKLDASTPDESGEFPGGGSAAKANSLFDDAAAAPTTDTKAAAGNAAPL